MYRLIGLMRQIALVKFDRGVMLNESTGLTEHHILYNRYVELSDALDAATSEREKARRAGKSIPEFRDRSVTDLDEIYKDVRPRDAIPRFPGRNPRPVSTVYGPNVKQPQPEPEAQQTDTNQQTMSEEEFVAEDFEDPMKAE